MRILLIGGTGQLGGDLVRNNPGHDLVVPGREELDVVRTDQVSTALAVYRPELVINCAAFHNVPLCETRPDAAFQTNCVAMRDLAVACRHFGARLLTFSSDYVFGGDRREPYAEDDLPQPLQIYGISRLAGEHAVLSSAPGMAIVIRTCGLYGRNGARSKGGNFVDGRIADARAGRTIEMTCEQIVAPTSSDDLSRAVFALIEEGTGLDGIYHLVNAGACSWYEFTCEIVRLSGFRTSVIPVDRGGKSGEMRRPIYSVLENVRARKLGVTLRPWQEALEEYLRIKYPETARRA